MILKNLARDTIIYGGGDFLSKIIVFFTFPILATNLSPEAFGSYELIMTCVALFGMVMSCGMSSSVQRYYWDKEINEEKRPVIVSSGLITIMTIGLLLSALIALIILTFKENFLRVSKHYDVIALLSGVVIMLMTQLNKYIGDVFRLHFAPFRFLFVTLTSRSLTSIVGLIFVIVFGLGIEGLLGAQALILFIVFPIATILAKKDLTFKIEFKWIKELLVYGYPFIFTGIAYWLFNSMDRWFLLSMSSIEEIGIYSVSFRFSNILYFVSLAFGQAWSPLAIKLQADNPVDYQYVYGDILTVLFAIMSFLAIALMLFSGEVIGALMPSDYYASVGPLLLLSFGVVFQTTQQVTGIGISLVKKTFIFTRVAIITAFLNAILNYLFISYWEALGASLATAISYIFLTFSYLYFTQKLHPIYPNYKRLFCIMLALLTGLLLGFKTRSLELSFSLVLVKSLILSVFAFLFIKLISLDRLKKVT